MECFCGTVAQARELVTSFGTWTSPRARSGRLSIQRQQIIYTLSLKTNSSAPEIIEWYECIWPNEIIFHQPRFPWNKGDLPLNQNFGAQVVWGRYNLTRIMVETLLWFVLCVLLFCLDLVFWVGTCNMLVLFWSVCNFCPGVPPVVALGAS